ncbi:MAG: CNH domain-containing protein [Benjaminiella poitrasii]|nr:MAG: CNH domain-containing protein [Benjaminiella poitrasii]
MPHTSYTLQLILSAAAFNNSLDQLQKSLSPRLANNSFFSTKTSPSQTHNETLNATSTIESVAAWDSDLYCGTQDGLILHYSLQDDLSSSDEVSEDNKNTINLGLGKKPVDRILLIPQVSKAVVLCDSTLSFFSLPFLDPIPSSVIQPIKNVSCFTHDIGEEGRIGEDGTVELCVIKRRAIQLYKIGGESMHLKKELPLADGARTLTRHRRILCLADAHMYKLINLQQSSVTPLLPTPPANPALTVVVRQDEFLVVGEGTIGIFVNANGDAIRGTLQWSHYPHHITVDYPYIVALLPNNSIEIHNVTDQKLIQTIPDQQQHHLQGMASCHGIKVWMSDVAQRLKLHHNNTEHPRAKYAAMTTTAARTLVFSKTGVWAQITTPLTTQVDRLLAENQIEEAIHLADDSHDTRIRAELDYSYQRCGLVLLRETLFEDAFMLMSKGNMDPRMVIQMFEGLANSKWLKKEQQQQPSVFEGVWSRLQELGTIKEVVQRALNGTNNEMRRTLLMNAREALERYLRVERNKHNDQVISTVIDTSLLKIYMSQKNDAAIYRLLEEPNNCSVEDSARALTKAKKFDALSVMYRSKRLYEKVLEIWTKMYAGELEDDTVSDEKRKSVLERIKGLLMERDIRDEDLPLSVVMHYAWWLTDQSPCDGVEIFTKSPRRHEMDRDSILERLEDEAQKTYLEYLVLTEKSERADYHTRLACSYIKDIQRDLNDPSQSEEIKNTLEGFKEHVESTQRTTPYLTFVGFLESQPSPSHLIQLRVSLIRLLQTSELYSADTLLDALTKAGPLDIEKVIVYGKMNKHKEALEILIHDLHDFVGAETYCVTNGKSPMLNEGMFEEDYLSSAQLNERRTLFTMLFKSYIAIKDSDLMIAKSMHLLNTQGFYLDTLKVLEMIPENWPIDMLQDFLIRSLRRSLDDYNESQIELALSRGENLEVNSEMIVLQKDIGPVVVEHETTCIKCHRDIGESLFVRESECGQLLHLHCAKVLGLVDNQ